VGLSPPAPVGRVHRFDHSRVGGHTIASTTQPSPDFAPITGAIAVMAAAVDRCTVNGEEVIPQPGGFYGGWITSWIVWPFKGIPGSTGW
jgi:hypothetical protein